jgi:hypothetical protein
MPQGLGRGAQYSPLHNQASSENPYPTLDRSGGELLGDGLPIAVMNYGRGGEEMTRNVTPPDPMTLDHLPYGDYL